MEEDDFHKQRRNLLLISFFILFMNLTGMQIGEFDLIGVKTTLSNPSLLPSILMVILVYSLVRFIQSAHDLKDKNFKSTVVTAQARYLGFWLLRVLSKAKFPDIVEAQKRGVRNFNASCIPQPVRHKKRIGILHIRDDVDDFVTQLNQDISNYLHFLTLGLACAYLIFRTTKFTEYFLPPLFALLSLASFHDRTNQALIHGLQLLSDHL